jgi:hypothetical protein
LSLPRIFINLPETRNFPYSSTIDIILIGPIIFYGEAKQPPPDNKSTYAPSGARHAHFEGFFHGITSWIEVE